MAKKMIPTMDWIIYDDNPLLKTKVGGQAVLGRLNISPTPWLTERHGYDPLSYENQRY